MTTISQHEQDVFAPMASLQKAGYDMDGPAESNPAQHQCPDLPMQHHRHAAQHRLHRLRAIESLRRPSGAARQG